MFLALFLGGVTITLAPEAKIRGTEIELGAIAKVAGDDAAEVARVRAMRLGYAPAPGYTRLLVGARIQSDLARALPDTTLSLRGSETCRVHPATERIQGTALEASAKGEVLRWVGSRDVEIDLISPVADIEVPSGDKSVELRAVLADGVRGSGPMNVPVRILVDGALYRTVWTNWRVALWEDASVLREPVRAGQTITHDMLERRRIQSAGVGPEAPLSPALVIGTSVARDMPAGVPLREADVVRPVLVRRGDALFLEVRRGNVHARVPVVADQDGRSGERIRVTIVDARRTLNATVVASDLAVIDMSDNNG